MKFLSPPASSVHPHSLTLGETGGRRWPLPFCRSLRSSLLPSLSRRQMTDAMVGGAKGPEEYGRAAYCRQGMLDRNGSELLNR